MELLKILENDNIKVKINEIINKINNNDYNNLSIKLMDDEIFSANYYFINNDDNKLSCIINQEYVNIISDIPKSIILGGLIIYIISFITKKERNLLVYSCVNSYILEENKKDYTDIIWNNPKPLPLLEITDNNQKNIDDIKLDDIHFLGLD